MAQLTDAGITITVAEGQYRLRFSYEPSLVAAVRQLPRRRYLPEHR